MTWATLSSAMLAGALRHPQCRFSLMVARDGDIAYRRRRVSCGGDVVGCCALGAIYIGLGINPAIAYLDYDNEEFTILSNAVGYDVSKKTASHPKIAKDDNLIATIIELGDSGLWTTEMIAAWLSSIGL